VRLFPEILRRPIEKNSRSQGAKNSRRTNDLARVPHCTILEFLTSRLLDS
jgi:hypothetical protein